jgi:hypothetical protein
MSNDEAFHVGVSISGDAQLGPTKPAVTERYAQLLPRSILNTLPRADDQILLRGYFSVLWFDRRRKHSSGPIDNASTTTTTTAQ